jgi:hypothetical protein
MRLTIFGTAAVVVGLPFLSPAARAADTMLLAGTGSLMKAYGDDTPVANLKGDLTNSAATIQVARGFGHVGGFGRVGGFAPVGRVGGWGAGWRGAGWGGFRGWGWGGWRGAGWGVRGWGWNRPWVGAWRPWGWGWNRPWGWGWGWNRPWVGAWRPWGWGWGWNRPWGWGWGGTSWGVGGWPIGATFPSSSVIVWSSPNACTCPDAAIPSTGWESGPPPQQNGGYQYDSGPAQPVPAPPAPQPPAAPRTPPIATGTMTAAPGRPQITVGYQGRYFSGSIAFQPGARVLQLRKPIGERMELAPPPRPDGTFRYDGGPSRTVPLPSPDRAAPTEPAPAIAPALNRVAGRVRPKVTYPAYGERLTEVDPFLVKRTGN